MEPRESSAHAVQKLVQAAQSNVRTVQLFAGRFEVIYAGADPVTDPRCGTLEAVVHIDDAGGLRWEGIR